MKWKDIKEIAWSVMVFVLAICLIENQDDSFLVEVAGDFFGALGLMFLAVGKALRYDSSHQDR